MKLQPPMLAVLLAAVVASGCATVPAPAETASPVVAPTSPSDAGELASLRAATQRLGGVRPAFRACVDAAAGAAVAMQACVDSEMQYQQSRLDGALAARRGRSSSNGNVDEIQAQWAAERERLCGSDMPGIPAAKRIEAGICRLEITAARADALSR